MINLIEYIIEAKETNNNKERLEQLRKWLKGKKYEDYVDTLNKLLEDPKSKTLLADGFDSELCDVKFKYKGKLIKAKDIHPTQNEIDIDSTIGKPLTSIKNLERDFAPEIVVANMPLVTFNGRWVIDGHHRWSEIAAINPEGKMLCFDYSADITIEEMLKAVQGTIATVMAQKNEKLPSQHVAKGHNIYDMSEKEIKDYVKEHITQRACQLIDANVDEEVKTPEEAIDYIIKNVINIRENNKPSTKAPDRDYMPQTSKGGSDITDKQTSFPDKVGSALNKLANKTVDGESIK